jgi:hypothetical protein
MDVDIDDYEAQIAVPRQLHVQRRPHIVDDEHPFDLDAYITNYNGSPYRSYTSLNTIKY